MPRLLSGAGLTCNPSILTNALLIIALQVGTAIGRIDLGFLRPPVVCWLMRYPPWQELARWLPRAVGRR